MSTQIVNDKGTFTSTIPSPVLKGIAFRADAAHLRGACEITDILNAVAAGKAREIALSREVGDSVLYHSRSTKLRRDQSLLMELCTQLAHGDLITTALVPAVKDGRLIGRKSSEEVLD